MIDKQKTLKASISFTGKGLHTGKSVTMTILPAESDNGIIFRRVDIEGQPEVEALADYVVDTSRGTTICKNDAKVYTIEHIMSALWSMGVDNALIEINGPEVPIMDGSAREYAARIMEVGLQEQEQDRHYYELKEKVSFSIPEKGVSIDIEPADEFTVSVEVDYNSRVLGVQNSSFVENGDYKGEIAPCRTFVFLHEVEPLLNANLIKGGDLENAIVVVEHEISEEEIARLTALFNKGEVKVTNGYLNHLQLRFSNEIARHKMLDILGDMALLGKRFKGKVTACRPGHYANTETMKIMRKAQ